MAISGIEDARQEEYVRAAEKRIMDMAFECGADKDIPGLVQTAILAELRSMYIVGFARGIDIADQRAAEDSAIAEEERPEPLTKLPRGIRGHLDPFSGE